MSDKPSAAWYLAPIFLGIIGSAIMWYVLKDEDHPDSPKMVKKGWVIGIVLTVISFAWIPLMLIPMMVFDVDQQMGDHMQVIPEPDIRMVPEPFEQQFSEPFEDQFSEPFEQQFSEPFEDQISEPFEEQIPEP